jgi:hypothetical protein
MRARYYAQNRLLRLYDQVSCELTAPRATIDPDLHNY